MRVKIPYFVELQGCITKCPFGFNIMVGSVLCKCCSLHGSINREKKIVYCKYKKGNKDES
jgi:hypothetical protein